LGVYLGVKSAVHRDKAIDHITRSVSIIGWSLPSFWLGIVLLAIFFAGFGIFPPERLGTTAELYVTSDAFIRYTHLNTIDALLNGKLWIFVDALQRLVLPTITLITIQIALIVRVMRSSMLEALSKGYIVTGRAKGLTEKEVVNKHARRNALIPIITLSGLLAAGMLNGVVITETIFTINGVGRLGARAALTLDIPTVLGFAIFSGGLFVVANLLVDILYAYVDPRIRLG
jgi:peptide/nickel transport system permease protein